MVTPCIHQKWGQHCELVLCHDKMQGIEGISHQFAHILGIEDSWHKPQNLVKERPLGVGT